MTDQTKSTPWTPCAQYTKGDRVEREITVYPSWWRRVFLRKKPKTVVKIYEATQTGGAGVWMIQK
jgi:hypothetical protein